jgi:hypothetical protein
MEIQLDFISSSMLSTKGTVEKVDLILDRIKRNVIVVLEEGLKPWEEAELIEATMRDIDSKDFFGIEFYRIDNKEQGLRDKIAEFIAGKRTGMTIVGPTRMVEAIKREPDYISMLARSEKVSKVASKKAKAKKRKAKKKKGKGR